MAGPNVKWSKGTSYLVGAERIVPTRGSPGYDARAAKYPPYVVPGEDWEPAVGGGDSIALKAPTTSPFVVAGGAKQGQPDFLPTSNKWWSAAFLQHGSSRPVLNPDNPNLDPKKVPDGQGLVAEEGWIKDTDYKIRRKGTGQVVSARMVNEPFCMDFIDFDPPDFGAGRPYPDLFLPRGLRLWNQSKIHTFACKWNGKEETQFGFGKNYFSTGVLAQSDAKIVTVGLQGVRPLRNPPAGQLSNVKVDNYSEFHVEMSYSGGGSTLAMTMASGAPFVWFERKVGTAPFQLWAGSRISKGGDPNRSDDYALLKTSIRNAMAFKLGMRINPPVPVLPDPPYDGIPKPQKLSEANPWPRGTAGYVVIANAGEWEQQSYKEDGRVVLSYGNQDDYTWLNRTATKVVVIALPHNISLDDKVKPDGSPSDLDKAIEELLPYASRRITGSDIYYPPFNPNQPKITVNGVEASVGHDRDRGKLVVGYCWTSEPFFQGATKTLVGLLPHHRKYLRASDNKYLIGAVGAPSGTPKYVYNTLKGEMWLYALDGFVRELDTHGLLAFLDHAEMSWPQAFDEVYGAMRTWFWQEEPPRAVKDSKGVIEKPNHADSFAANYASYGGVGNNGYLPSWAALFESLIVADQLASSIDGPVYGTAAKAIDQQFGIEKFKVAGMMRDRILDVLKQLVHNWFDVFTSQCLQHNTQYSAVCAYPSGYMAVSHLNDHHFHWGYFLRAAAAIGRHDRAWLEQHADGLRLLIQDVTNWLHDVDRAAKKPVYFPRFRNFNPYYGHSWASGIAMLDGQDQESTSEALNLAFGMVELGMLQGDDKLVDVGLLLFEEEVCAAEQYWFNVDANLGMDPAGNYNGNWPKEYVRFQWKGANQNSTLTTLVGQKDCQLVGHFGGEQGCYAIQMVPVGAINLRLERHYDWFDKSYDAYLAAMKAAKDVYDTAQQQIVKVKPDYAYLPFEAGQSYENVIAMWQAALQPKEADKALDPCDRRGLNGARSRIARTHSYCFQAINAPALSWAWARSYYGKADFTVRSNAIHYGAFIGPDRIRRLMVYNPKDTPLDGVKFWDRTTGKEIRAFPSIAPRTMLTIRELEPLYTSYALTRAQVPPGRLYLRQDDGKVALGGSAGAATIADDSKPSYPTDLSSLLLSTIKLPVGRNAALSYTGRFSGRLIAQEKLQYTRFSLFVNPALWPGVVWDLENALGVGVEMSIKYDFGSGAPRIEEFVGKGRFNLEPHNWWLGRNNLTEFWTTTAPLTRLAELNPNEPTIAGKFPLDVKDGSVTLTIWQVPLEGRKNPDVYLSYNCPVDSHRASWICPPYEVSS